jgi:peptidoglycan/LPS O-acetylase OafA/YrhL
MLLIPTSDAVDFTEKVSFPYYNLLDGLRGFAVFAILYYHSSLPLIFSKQLHLGSGGFIGVDVFFVLSSFLITSLLLKEYLNHGSISIKSFYTRRILRLSPPLLTALIIFIPIITFIDWRIAVKDIFYTLTYTANIAMSLQAFIPAKILPGFFYHTWSLAMEEQFYLVFPFALLYIINKQPTFFSNNFRILVFVIAIFVTAPILKPLLQDGVYTFPLWRIGEFFIGFLTALVYANIMWKEALFKKASFFILSQEFLEKITIVMKSSMFSLYSFVVFFAFILFAHAHSWFAVSVGHLLISIATAYLLLQITVCPNRVLRYFLGHKIMVSVGLISYGLYIYHLPIMLMKDMVFRKFPLSQFIPLSYPVNTSIAILLQDSLYFLLSFATAYISYRFIEKPIMKYKTKFSKA